MESNWKLLPYFPLASHVGLVWCMRVSYRVCFACAVRRAGCFRLSGPSADGIPALGPSALAPRGSLRAAIDHARHTDSWPFCSPATETPARSQCHRCVSSPRLRDERFTQPRHAFCVKHTASSGGCVFHGSYPNTWPPHPEKC